MEPVQTFPTGNRDLDRLLLLRLDDRELLNTLSLGTKNRLINRYLNDEEFWRIRFEKMYPSDFDKVNNIKTRSWKDFSLLLIRYLDLAKLSKGITAIELAAQGGHKDLVDYFIYKGAEGNLDDLMKFSAQGGNRDLVDYFISKGARLWNYGLYGAARGGHRDLVEFFISKGAKSWNWAMENAAEGGHRDLVDFFISQGANDLNMGMMHAAIGGHRDLVDFFISQGANNWNWGMKGAARGGHRYLVDFFISQGAKDWYQAEADAVYGGHQDLVDFFKRKMKERSIARAKPRRR